MFLNIFQTYFVWKLCIHKRKNIFVSSRTLCICRHSYSVIPLYLILQGLKIKLTLFIYRKLGLSNNILYFLILKEETNEKSFWAINSNSSFVGQLKYIKIAIYKAVKCISFVSVNVEASKIYIA